MKSRLEKFIKHLGIKNTDFEKRAGLSNGFVNNIGDNVRESSIRKITSEFPELNIDWWKTGIGIMLNNSQVISGNKSNNNINGVAGDVTISHNELTNMIELQKGYQDLQKELTNRLKTSQDQLTESQKQISMLLEIIKNK